MSTDEEMINNIKYIAKKNGLVHCYNMPKPNGVAFYAMEYKLNKYIVLTYEEMDKYFSKYSKWITFFVPHDTYIFPSFYVIQNDEIKDFLLAKYKKRSIEEQLGKI